MRMSGKRYLCAAGDTFDSAALTLYGDEKYASELMSANPTKLVKTVFAGGEELEIPVVTLQEDREENDRMPSKAPWKEA